MSQLHTDFDAQSSWSLWMVPHTHRCMILSHCMYPNFRKDWDHTGWCQTRSLFPSNRPDRYTCSHWLDRYTLHLADMDWDHNHRYWIHSLFPQIHHHSHTCRSWLHPHKYHFHSSHFCSCQSLYTPTFLCSLDSTCRHTRCCWVGYNSHSGMAFQSMDLGCPRYK